MKSLAALCMDPLSSESTRCFNSLRNFRKVLSADLALAIEKIFSNKEFATSEFELARGALGTRHDGRNDV